MIAILLELESQNMISWLMPGILQLASLNHTDSTNIMLNCSEASEVSSRVVAAYPSRPRPVQSSQAINGQAKAMPPRILSTPVLNDFASPPVPAQGELQHCAARTCANTCGRIRE